MNKKGALELSMNTIIIIVIGVVLLSLGLMFVRGLFGQVESLSKSAFETADAEISIISNINQPLTLVPGELEVKRGSAEVVDVIIANLGETSTTVTMMAISKKQSIDCSFADTLTPTSNPYTLNSGEQASLKLIIDEKNGALGTAVCNIKANGLNGDNEDSLVITVVK